MDYEEAEVKSVLLGRVELGLRRKTVFVWQDDEKISGDVEMVVKPEEEPDLDSSRTTEMDIEDDEDLYAEV